MTTFAGHLLDGTHASRPAATAVPAGTLYSCTDHALVYQSDGATWTTWATLGGGDVVAGSVDSEAATDGQVLTADGAGAAAWETPAGGAAGAVTLLSSTTLGSAGTFDITSISGSYNDLICVLIARTTDASAYGQPVIRFNNDSGSNYTVQRIRGLGAAVAASLQAGTTSVGSLEMPGNSASAGYFGVVELTVFGYASTTWRKSLMLRSQYTPDTSDFYLLEYMGYWNSTAAINRITAVGGGPSNFVTGSQLRIYGRL